MTPILRRFCADTRCEVHQCLLAVRDSKPGWFDVFCPDSVACVDNGQLYSSMVSYAMSCQRHSPRTNALISLLLLLMSKGPVTIAIRLQFNYNEKRTCSFFSLSREASQPIIRQKWMILPQLSKYISVHREFYMLTSKKVSK